MGEEERRQSGIAVIGDVPWGTHFCQFYKTKEDLIDLLVPYFKEGLAHNEFCMWVTSEPVTTEEAAAALQKALPDLDRYLATGQLEILPYTEWYHRDGTFDADRVLNGWVEKLDQARARGFEGLRLTGNTFWLESKEWKAFTAYEEQANRVIGRYRMMALCTYSIEKCGASEVIDVVSNHQFALIKREGQWVRIQSGEHKRVEAALRESEERFRSTFDQAAVGIAHVSPSGRWLRVNRKLCEIVGYGCEELLARTFQDITHPDDLQADLDYVRGMLAGEIATYSMEKRYIRKDGSLVWINLTVALVRDSQGNPDYFISVIEDISVRKQVEEELRRLTAELEQRVIERTAQLQAANRNLEQEIAERKRAESDLQFFKYLIDQTRDVIYVLSPEEGFRNVYVNEACCKHFGYPAETLLRMSVPDWDPDFPLERCEQVWQTLKTTKSLAMFQTRHRLSSGKVVPVEVTASYLAFGEKEYIAGTTRDITERKRVEDALRRSEDWFRSLIENATDLVTVLDIDGTVRYESPSVYRLSGHTADDLLGKPVDDFIHSDDLPPTRIALAKTLQAPGMPQSVEARFRTHDGQWLFLEATGQAVQDQSGRTTIVVNSRDITERKREQQRLEEQLRIKAFAADVGTAITGLLSVSDSLQACTEAMVHHLGAAFGRIWTLDPGHNELVLQASAGIYTNLEGRHSRIPVGQYKIGLIAQERKPHLTNQVIGDPRVHDQEWAKREGMVAFAGYPLLVEGRVLGVMAMFTRQKLSKDVLEAMQTVAHGIAQFIERKHKEELLRSANDSLHAVIQASPIGMVVLNPNGTVKMWNPASEHMFGWSEQEVLGRPLPFVPPDKQEEHRALRTRVLRNEAFSNYEVVRRRKDGSLAEISLSTAPLHDASGNISGILGLMVDITERKRAEKALQESEQRFRTIVETSPDGIFINRKSVDQIIYINSTGLRLLGATNPDQVLGKSVFRFLHPSFHAIVRDRIKQFSHLNVPSPVIEEKYVRLDGTPIDVEVTAIPLLYQGEEMFFVVVRDITTRKEMEAQARQLERLSALNQLLGGIAHELKNPLFILTGVVQLAREKVEQKQYGDLSTDCQKIQETAKRLTAIVERFLHLAQPVPSQPEQCSVQVVLQETLDSLGHELTANRIRVVTTYAPDLPAIQADPAQLREVFQNLIQNAVQAMAEVHRKGTLTVSAALVTDAETRRQGDGVQVARHGEGETGRRGEDGGQIDVEKGRRSETEITALPLRPLPASPLEGNWIEVKIQDDGPGILPEYRTKIFEPFFTTKPPDKATGLGLWIVRSNLMMLRGTVQMETDVGQGTTFIVKLPTVTEPPVSHDPQASESAQA